MDEKEAHRADAWVFDPVPGIWSYLGEEAKRVLFWPSHEEFYTGILKGFQHVADTL